MASNNFDKDDKNINRKNQDQDFNSDNSSQNSDSGDEKEFPGYPHYPSSQDITHPTNGMKKVDADPDSINRKTRAADIETPSGTGMNPETGNEEDDDLGIVRGTEADVTEEDLKILGPKDGDLDMGDDEILRNPEPEDVNTDEDLDIPGSDLDDSNEEIGEEDEENNYYSLGGERHEDLEEDNQQ